ncbi:MAG: hypothetical protein ACR2GG_08755, partial [Gemmatimonadaceae bacterium]
LVDGRARADGDIALFSEMLLHNGLAIREAVNSGERTFPEVMRLLERGRRFKDWLRDQPHNDHLLEAYLRDATATTWAERLPRKAFRWIVFQGLGAFASSFGAHGVGTTAAMAISIGDTFLLDHLTNGWCPNQFVRGPLEKFARLKKP